jgi:hypothetical protein
MKKLLLVLLVLVPRVACATTRMVNTSGMDTGNCSILACRTITYGNSQLAAGDTLSIGSGNYDETNINPTGGSIGNPTIIKSLSRNGAHVQPANAQYGFQPTHGYVTIDGIYIDCAPHYVNACGGVYVPNSITPNLPGLIFQHGTINKADNTSGDPGSEHSGIEGNFTGAQILDTDFIQVGKNDFYSHGVYIGNNNSSDNNIVDGNRFTGGSCFAIHLFHPNSNNTVRNNLISGDQCAGIILAWGPGTKIYNNLVINGVPHDFGGGNLGGGNGIDVCSMPVTSAFVYSNVLYGNAGYGLIVDSGCTGNSPSGVVLKDNLFYQNGAGAINDATGIATCSNNFNVVGCSPTQGSTDPLFANAPGGDFHIAAASPAATFGANLCSTFCTDFDGKPRPPMGAWSAGAFVPSGTPNTWRGFFVFF